MKDRPHLLYRYVNTSTAWKCLKNASLAFIPPTRFNDPFDTNPALDFSFREEQLRALEKECPPGMTFDRESIKGAMLESRKAFMETQIGAACFSSKGNDPLMWAHYGDRHRGVMIGFDATHSEFSGAEPVSYSKDRPRVYVDDQEVGKKLLVKSGIWEGEGEWRMIANLSQCEVKIVNGTPVYIQQLERNCFASITFGCKAEEAFVVAISNSLHRWQLTHCEVWRVRLCDATYNLIQEPIDIT
ncbi:MAG TPA: DUF2971 domain-containing protein [Chthoniobacterales bacterium]|nr:DUF2971 domain-containing protein [Chthoniobacterales bacterium]